MIDTLTETTVRSLQNFWDIVMGFIPSLIGALVILIIGLVIATGLRSLVERLINAVKLDNLLRQVGVHTYTERAGIHMNSAKFFGALVYWFFVIVFVLAATDTLGLVQVSQFLNGVLNYIPNVVVAVLILLVSFVLGNFLKSLVRASVMGARLHASKFLGVFTWWIVVIVGLGAALQQLQVADLVVAFINYLVIGIVAMLAIAGGIAFGLGGKEYAAHVLDKVKRDVE